MTTQENKTGQQFSKRYKSPIPSQEFLEKVEKFKLKKLDDNFIIASQKIYEQKLKSYEQAIYFRISMRGYASHCEESYENIALACDTCVKSVHRTVEKLKALNMVWVYSGKKERTCNYIKLIDPQFWKKPIQETGTVSPEIISNDQETRTDSPKDSDCQSKRLGLPVPQTVPENRTLKQNPVCGKKTTLKPTHTKKQKFKPEKIDPYRSMGIDLSKRLCSIFKVTFILNEDCEDIIDNIITALNCSVKEFRQTIKKMKDYEDDYSQIFSQRRADIKVIEQDLTRFVERHLYIKNKPQLRVV